MLAGHGATERWEPPSALGRTRLSLEERQTRRAGGSALLSPRGGGGGGFQTASPRVSCSVGGGSNVDQEMVEKLGSFPACSHQVNQPQRREELLLSSFPWGLGVSGQAGLGGWQVQPELWKGFSSHVIAQEMGGRTANGCEPWSESSTAPWDWRWLHSGCTSLEHGQN